MTFRDILESKIDAYQAEAEVIKFGYKPDKEYNSQYNTFHKGKITVTIKKVKNNSNLKSLIGSWEDSVYTYMFDQKRFKTIKEFLVYLEKKDPKRKATMK